MNIFKRKIACLVSLLVQVETLVPQELKETFETGNIEHFLDLPEISDHDWEMESPENQLRFLSFLNANIFYYESLLDLLEKERFEFQSQHTT